MMANPILLQKKYCRIIECFAKRQGISLDEASWLYNAIAKYFILPKYSVYDFRDEIPNEVVGNKRILNHIKKSLNFFNKCIQQKNVDSFVKQVSLLADYLSYNTKEEHCKKVYETICDSRFYPAFNIDELKRIAITFHSSKGLEFDQVILFVSDYKLASEEDIYNHYVASTRAKTKLILVYINNDWNAGQFAKNINTIVGKSGLKMKDVVTIINNKSDLKN